MKTMKTLKTLSVTVLPMIMMACTPIGKSVKFVSEDQGSVDSTGVSGGCTGADLIGCGPGTGAGGGATLAGKGSTSAPTAEAVIVRLENGLENRVNSRSGNFARSLAQVRTNLPKVTDPTKATGFDQAQLLAYGACSDLTTGNTPLMQSQYNVTKNGTIAAQQASLVAAGVRMLNRHVAGLASQSQASPQVTQVFTDLVQKIAATNGNTSTIAFMAVCIAANTAGATLMGY